MNIDDLTDQTMSLLSDALEDAHEKIQPSGLACYTQIFSYRHARNVLNLAEDFLILESELRFYSPSIVLRAMLESFFSIAAAAQNPNFPQEKTLSETLSAVNSIEKWIKHGGLSDELDEALAQYQGLEQRLRDHFNMTGNPDWSVRRTAEEGKLLSEYIRAYFMLSLATHSTISGLITHERQGTFGFRRQNFLMVVAATAGYLPRLVPMTDSSRYSDQGAKLLKCICDHVEKGTFTELNDAEEDLKAELFLVDESDGEP
ncbi:MAG: DUF5677 domain-containing protein [Verrucomicrobiota bacterium]